MKDEIWKRASFLDTSLKSQYFSFSRFVIKNYDYTILEIEYIYLLYI